MEENSDSRLMTPVNPVRIPVPLMDSHLKNDKNEKIFRPIPQRATSNKSASSDRHYTSSRAKEMEQRSLTDPRQMKTSNSKSLHHSSNPIKLRSLSPTIDSMNNDSLHNKEKVSLPPENDKIVEKNNEKKSGFVTNVKMDNSLVKESSSPFSGKSTTVVNICGSKNNEQKEQDSGYQILTSKDEEAERDIGIIGYHDHHIYKPVNRHAGVKSKPKRKGQISNKTSSHEHQKPKRDDEKTLENVSHLLDVKAAIERLRLHSPMDEMSCNSSDSSGSICSNDVSKIKAGNTRKINNLSQETLNNSAASVTSTADEFVWIDSHNRLVELQQLPWNNGDISQVIAKVGSFHFPDSKSSGEISLTNENFTSPDVLPRISYYMQRALVRIARESQRLSKTIGKCGPREISTAFKIVLSPGLAINALRACIRASTMYSMSGDTSSSSKQSKSERAGLALKVGRMHQWMCLVKIGKFIHNMASIYLTAGMECLVEEVVTKCLALNHGGNSTLTAPILEQVIASHGDFWGLFQPYAHLSSSRVATGTLTLSPCLETLASSIEGNGNNNSHHVIERNIRQILLTTCVGSTDELEEMVHVGSGIFKRLWSQTPSSSSSNGSCNSIGHSPYKFSSLLGSMSNMIWCPEAITSLYHFMRCSQLEYVGQDGKTPIQELVYERPYMVLPPIMEWVRVVIAFIEHRKSNIIDSDDVLQAARVLLPGMDCPIRSFTENFNPISIPSKIQGDELQFVSEMKQNMAFKMLMSGRKDLIPHALQLLPSGYLKLNITNYHGFTPLQLAALKGDINVVRILIDTGAQIDATSNVIPDNESWTPLCYAAIGGHAKIVRILLERGAKVNGCSGGEDVSSETPLQLAAGAGHSRIVELLISYGANPFQSKSSPEDVGLGLSSVSQIVCPSAVSIAAIHGHRILLHDIINQSLTHIDKDKFDHNSSGRGSMTGDEEVLSLEEILAEGASDDLFVKKNKNSSHESGSSSSKRLSKTQIKKLQEAMYHASECGNVDISIDLRNMGVSWTPFTWVTTIKVAQENHLTVMINELLQDFVGDWLDDHSNVFLTETALPLLFSIFRNCKNESTILMLADIFTICYGKDPVTGFGNRRSSPHKIELRVSSNENPKDPPPRIDSKFINNPELSDLQFRVEGRIFYAHKLALITASPRFQSMLNSRFCEGNPPILQINDIRYNIFNLVMTYLYNGGLGKIQIEPGDVLELMAAANFFQLPGLLRHCENHCAKLIDLDNIVSYYIHAKVYSAFDLLDYCEGFLIKNMVTLLTYDDSVKRLIFGKKLQNHDVINGLLLNLQQRIRNRS